MDVGRVELQGDGAQFVVGGLIGLAVRDFVTGDVVHEAKVGLGAGQVARRLDPTTVLAVSFDGWSLHEWPTLGVRSSGVFDGTAWGAGLAPGARRLVVGRLGAVEVYEVREPR